MDKIDGAFLSAFVMPGKAVWRWFSFTMHMKNFIELALQVAKSDTEKEFRCALEQAIDFMKGTTYSATTFDSNVKAQTHKTDRMAPEDHKGIYSLPSSYLDLFLNHSVAKTDPVMQHLRQASVPIYWDHATDANAALASQWEMMEAHGLRQGLSIALHPEPHRHFAIGLEWNRSKPLSTGEKRRYALALQTLAIFAEPAAYKIWQAPRHKPFEPQQPLTPRELECLYWVSRGMTDELIGRLVEISPRTVRKLNTANRTEAAVTATRLGLLLQPPMSHP